MFYILDRNLPSLQRFFYRVHVKIVIYDKDIVIIETMELDVFKTFGFISTFIVQ